VKYNSPINLFAPNPTPTLNHPTAFDCILWEFLGTAHEKRRLNNKEKKTRKTGESQPRRKGVGQLFALNI